MKEYKSTMSEFVLKNKKSDFKKVKITSPQDSFNVIKQFYHDDLHIYESFFLLLLNKANNTIGYVKIAQGGIVAVYVDIQLIAKYTIDALASSIILAHNHPSGSLKPSEQDIRLTKRVEEAMAIFQVRVLDHIILGGEKYYSFADEGIL